MLEVLSVKGNGRANDGPEYSFITIIQIIVINGSDM